MDAVDKAVNPTHVIPEWCNPSLLKDEAQPLPASSRIDWLKPAMSIWCDGSSNERSDGSRSLPAALNS